MKLNPFVKAGLGLSFALLWSCPTLAALTAAAEDLGFVQSSEGDLGRLLRLLVSSRPGGSFLELGTGVGYGAAWLLDGMDADSRLVSVELEDDLQRIARATFDDDPRVEWVLGDGSGCLREAVARPERFAVVFADTWPGKYHDRDLAMELVKPHGWFVLDDLYPQPGWPDGHQANVDRLIADMQSVDGWRTEFLPWGSGLMLCVRD